MFVSDCHRQFRIVSQGLLEKSSHTSWTHPRHSAEIVYLLLVLNMYPKDVILLVAMSCGKNGV